MLTSTTSRRGPHNRVKHTKKAAPISGRKTDNKRRQKKLIVTIAPHARRHRAALDTRWSETDLSRGPTAQILRRIDQICNQPPAIKKNKPTDELLRF